MLEIRNVAVIGAGVMGSQIALAAMQAGFNVVVRTKRGSQGLNRLRESIAKCVSRNLMTNEQADEVLSKLKWTKDLTTAVENADLVVETIKEDLSAKRRLFKEIDNLAPKKAILASNTSSLSITLLAKVTKRPANVIGLHFFNPVFSMKLVEVTPIATTSKRTVETAVWFSQKLNKTPIVVKESPGFVVNRVLIPAINEAAYILMEGVASARDIDSALKLGAHHPMGPFELADLIGLDVCVAILETLERELHNEKYIACPLITEMVQKGYLGRKSGKGFYTYPSRG